MFSLCSCEYVDLECCWSRESRYNFLKLIEKEYPNTMVIASYHAVLPLKLSLPLIIAAQVQQPLTCSSDFEVLSASHALILLSPAQCISSVWIEIIWSGGSYIP